MIFKIRNFFFTLFWMTISAFFVIIAVSAFFVIIAVPILGIVLLFRYLKRTLVRNS